MTPATTLLRRCIAAIAVPTAALAIAGCGGFQTAAVNAAPAPVSLAGLQGRVLGGQFPINGGVIQLFQAGTSGYGQGASALVTGEGVLTNSNGYFSLTGLYQCTSGTQVYITSTGGNPGAGNNPNATLIAALGLCDNVPSISFIQLNEVTTIGTVYALAPFMNGLNIGAPPTNQAGLAAAFADVNTLVNYASGTSPGPAAGANATVPSAEIYALANSIANCVNSTGAGGGGACDKLFSYTTPNGGSAPADTVSAVINMVRNPSSNVSNILQLTSITPPFSTNFNSASDLTLSVTYSGNGLSAPSSLAIDASGNVWVANTGNNTVTGVSHAGAPLSGSSGYTAGAFNNPSAIAIDTSGYIWVANAGNNTLSKINSSGTNIGGSPFSGGGLSTPTSLAFDGLGNAWLSNSGNSSASEFTSTGTALSTAGTGFAPSGISSPVAIAVDPH